MATLGCGTPSCKGNSKITLDVYTQAVNSHKRAAQSKVVQMMVLGVGTNVGTKRDQAKTGTEA
jgi:hypothetical protein